MKRFIEGQSREQVTLLPECLDDFVGVDNPVRIVDAFVEELDLPSLGFDGSTPAATGRRLTTLLYCSRYTSTGISTASNPVAAWSVRHSAMWS